MADVEKDGGGAPPPSDFVSKLYAMLVNPDYQDIVRWSDTGESFVILDTQRFQSLVIPQVFNHSNFSSFVRQLNKYDFHKVRFKDSQSQVWEFQHPDFRPENSNRPSIIRRKPPTQSKKAAGDNGLDGSSHAAAEIAREVSGQISYEVSDLEERVSHLEESNHQLLKALKIQQNLVERLFSSLNMPDMRDELGQMAAANPYMSGFSANDKKMAAAASYDHDSGPLRPIAHPTSRLSDIPHTHSPPVHSPNSLTALLAVDDEGDRHTITRFLQEYGCFVYAVSNGVDLVQRAETGPRYDFIVCDVILSALDGISAAEVIRQTNSKSPIIVLAEQQPTPNVELYMLRGASAVLVRPFSRSDLFHILSSFSYATVYDGAAEQMKHEDTHAHQMHGHDMGSDPRQASSRLPFF